MRAILQRVSKAGVSIRGAEHAAIAGGFLVLLGIEGADGDEDVSWLCRKIAGMRTFADSEGKMNLSLKETGGSVMVVSQFTLHASTKKGNRPSFLRAAPPAHAEPLYESFCASLERELGKTVARGVFGADMQISLVNDGPVTLFLDSKSPE